MRVAVMIVALLAPVPAPAQEPVALSRYRLKLTAGALTTQVEAVDLPQFEERCMDEDGCEITLSGGASPTTFARGAHVRLFLTSPAWNVDGGSPHQDGNSTPETALTVNVDGGLCTLTDADDIAANDTALSFTLRAVAPGPGSPVYCALTVID
jgi:hypothetical protein